ncbi:DsbA family protein [Limibacter armeniacum]|uniref:DsbA family protein n=1 Tax=Limibacter armeniacum TaxID=466084 RepID=UPI002FE692F4
MIANNTLLYIGDPLCSWCYGIIPEIKKLKDYFGDQFDFKIALGGLRRGETTPMGQPLKQQVKKHWVHVHESSGMPFDFELLNTEKSFVYDTEKPCRAVVTFRMFNEEQSFSFFKDVQKAFYAEGKDTNDLSTYKSIVEKYGVDFEQFSALFNSDEIRKETRDEFLWVEKIGVKSFPTIALMHNDTLYAITIGYRKFEVMKAITEKILAE